MELIIGFIIAGIVGYFTAKDAASRGMSKWGWGLGTAASMFPVLLIYFIVRKPRIV